MKWSVSSQVLQEYERVSGRSVNFQKSNIFYSSNTISHTRVAIQNCSGIGGIPGFEKYLGLLTLFGRAKKAQVNHILDMVH